jgi:competence protein ComFC
MFSSLIRCPVCRERASSRLGCCQPCADELFQVVIKDDLIVLGVYKGKLEKAVRAFKFHRVRRLSKLFGEQLATAIKKSSWQVDSICPVPLHWTRRLERGYNQSALLGRQISKQTSLPYQPFLRRVKRTQQQAKLGKLERVSNVADAFVSKPCKGTILLIDDVITSGATTQACVRALLAGGASAVKVVAIARTPRS